MIRELLQQALDALDAITDDVDGTGLNTMPSFDKAIDAITALREALNAPEPEPVGTVYTMESLAPGGEVRCHATLHKTLPAGTKLYAAPPAAPIPDGMVMVPREPTEEMIQAAAGAWGESESGLHNAFAAALRGGIAASPAAPVVPIDMVLHCPKCGLQHIDAPDPWVAKYGADACRTRGFDLWTNPPHRSHLCRGCGHIWRPADVPTNGVAAVTTRGKADSPIAAPVVREPLTGDQLWDLWRLRGETPQFIDFVPIVRSIERAHGITGGGNG